VILVAPVLLDELSAKAGLAHEAAGWTRAALDLPPRALLLATSDDLAAGALYEQVVAGARPDVTVLVRQQLADRGELERRLRRAGDEVAPPDPRRDPLAALLAAELPRRTVAWEVGPDGPPFGALTPGVPVALLRREPTAPPPPRPLVARVEQLLSPRRDPLARRLASSALAALGRTYLVGGALAPAVALLQTAVAVDAAASGAAIDLGVALARGGDFAGARRVVEALLSRAPLHQIARVNAGRYALTLGDLDGAARHFEEAARRDPNDPAPLVGLGRVAERRGDRARSLELAREALRRAPADPEANAFKRELAP
jgi:tetratricopeptide (TPR) repeat protein